MGILDKILGISSAKEKLNEYREYLAEMDDIDKSATACSDEFMIEKSKIDFLDEMEEDKKQELLKSYDSFITTHKAKVSSLCNRRTSIQKAMSKLEKDDEISEDIQVIKSMYLFKKSYEKGEITKSVYFDILKAKQGGIKYADIIVRNPFGEVLILERVKNDFSKEGWCIPGGHVDVGESFKEAARRELKEETGLDFADHDFVKVGTYKKDGVEIEYFEIWLQWDKFYNYAITLNSREHSNKKWVKPEEMDDYHWEYENMLSNLNKIVCPRGKEKKEQAIVLKAFADGLISQEVFDEFLKKAHEKDELTKAVNKHYFSNKEREKLADKGEAMPDGSFPTVSLQDFKDAVRSIGRAKNPAAVKKYLLRRAKEKGWEEHVPDDWVNEKEEKAEKGVDYQESGERHFDGISGSSHSSYSITKGEEKAVSMGGQGAALAKESLDGEEKNLDVIHKGKWAKVGEERTRKDGVYRKETSGWKRVEEKGKVVDGETFDYVKDIMGDDPSFQKLIKDWEEDIEKERKEYSDPKRSEQMGKDAAAGEKVTVNREGNKATATHWDKESGFFDEEGFKKAKKRVDVEYSKKLFDLVKNKFDIKKDEFFTKSKEQSGVLEILYKALSEELLAWWQYYIVANFMRGRQRKSIENAFLEQADDELNDHASKLIQRISELGGDIEKVNSPDKWEKVAEGKFFAPRIPYDVSTLIDENIKSEEDAIKRYKGLCEYSKEYDPVTYLIAMEILKDEEEHLRTLKDFKNDLEQINKE